MVEVQVNLSHRSGWCAHPTGATPCDPELAGTDYFETTNRFAQKNKKKIWNGVVVPQEHCLRRHSHFGLQLVALTHLPR